MKVRQSKVERIKIKKLYTLYFYLFTTLLFIFLLLKFVMVINSFEDIISWQKAKEFTVSIYKIFKPIEDKIFFDQIYRASISIMNNIAEGFERGSEKDFVKFLYIAKASCAEVRSMLYLARDLDYLSDEKYTKLTDMSTEISKLIYGLIKSLTKD